MTTRIPGALATFAPELAPKRYGKTLAFAPDGRRLASVYSEYPEGGRSHEILVQWDLTIPSAPTVATRVTIGPNDGRAIAFAPDGSLLVGGYGDLHVYPPSGEAPPTKIALKWYVSIDAIAVAPSGTWAMVAPSRYLCECHFGDTEKRQDWENKHTDDVSSLSFSPDGKLMATSIIRKPYVHVWDVAKKTQLKRLTTHKGGTRCAVFSPDNTMLASGGDDRLVVVRDLTKGYPIRGTLTGHTQTVQSLAFSPDGKLLASGSAYMERGDGVRIWNPESGAAVAHLEWPGACVEHLAFSPDGNYLAAIEWTGACILWETAALTAKRA